MGAHQRIHQCGFAAALWPSDCNDLIVHASVLHVVIAHETDDAFVVKFPIAADNLKDAGAALRHDTHWLLSHKLCTTRCIPARDSCRDTGESSRLELQEGFLCPAAGLGTAHPRLRHLKRQKLAPTDCVRACSSVASVIQDSSQLYLLLLKAAAAMLLLFETAAGFALFKVLKEGKLKETDVRLQAPACGSQCPTL